jgi:glycosyltransferase involved in cell wall biosynthesis
MKVLNVVDGSGWTGGVEQAFLLTRELRELEIDARLAVHSGNPVYREASGAGLPVYAYEGAGAGAGPFRALRSLLGEDYDVVVGHKPGAIRQLILPLLLDGARDSFVGVRRVSFPVSRLTVYRVPPRVVAVSESVRDVLGASGLPRERIAVIPSGVDTDLFRPSEERRSKGRKRFGLEGKVVILNLAKFVPGQKGQGHLLAVAARLKGKYPLRVFLAGLETDGEEARRMVKDYGLEDTVELLGFRRDIPDLINAADLFVFPSLPGLDAIAGSVLQAMACGRVTVASGVGGIPEYLRDGDNGFLAAPGDEESLLGTMERALALSGEEKGRMGRLARKTVVDRYSLRAMAASYVRLFRQMPGAGSGKKP